MLSPPLSGCPAQTPRPAAVSQVWALLLEPGLSTGGPGPTEGAMPGTRGGGLKGGVTGAPPISGSALSHIRKPQGGSTSGANTPALGTRGAAALGRPSPRGLIPSASPYPPRVRPPLGRLARLIAGCPGRGRPPNDAAKPHPRGSAVHEAPRAVRRGGGVAAHQATPTLSPPLAAAPGRSPAQPRHLIVPDPPFGAQPLGGGGGAQPLPRGLEPPPARGFSL
jgi:hypothetical protein